MAKNNETAAVLDEELDIEETTEEVTIELTDKQIINEGINRVIEALGIDVQKNRYKAMRAIAYQAFIESIQDEAFEELVDRAIENAGDLPSGWEVARAPKAEVEEEAEVEEKPAPKKAAAKKAPAKATAKKTTGRRRPRA